MSDDTRERLASELKLAGPFHPEGMADAILVAIEDVTYALEERIANLEDEIRYLQRGDNN